MQWAREYNRHEPMGVEVSQGPFGHSGCHYRVEEHTAEYPFLLIQLASIVFTIRGEVLKIL